MADFAFLSVAELGRLLRSKQASATELAGYFLDRLERLGPRYNAVVAVTRERALAEAAQADREIKAGKLRGPLHGIPYGVKDLVATKDYPTTWGAEPYRQQKLGYDATVAERLRRGGRRRSRAVRDRIRNLGFDSHARGILWRHGPQADVRAGQSPRRDGIGLDDGQARTVGTDRRGLRCGACGDCGEGSEGPV